MADLNYAEQIARMKFEAAQRQQDQLVREAQALHQEVQENQQAAAEALQQGDEETARYYIEQLTEKEQEFAHVAERLPPQQPPPDPRMVEFVRRRTPFVERHGQAAYQAMDMAHRYATRPRNPNTTNPAHTGMGLQPGTQQYFDAMDSLLTMYAKDYGLRYDPEEKLLTPNQAARISGVSAERYNKAGREIASHGGFSWQRGGR